MVVRLSPGMSATQMQGKSRLLGLTGLTFSFFLSFFSDEYNRGRGARV